MVWEAVWANREGKYDAEFIKKFDDLNGVQAIRRACQGSPVVPVTDPNQYQWSPWKKVIVS